VGTGNTSSVTNRATLKAVHPRGHGEHSYPLFMIFFIHGSSPWARGTRVCTQVANKLNRFIPVGTGNTKPATSTNSNFSVHPRGHGEHLYDLVRVGIRTGSSPWARGTLYVITAHAECVRFIPVGTGNTASVHCWRTIETVHPRGHGEHINLQRTLEESFGSSPWARGTPFYQPR